MKNFRTFGVMIDVSRNAVMTKDALKEYLTLLSKMGYNMAMLYTEDVYEVEGEEYFGYMRGRYTKADLRELDEFAASIGVELIPCIQTLAHLEAYLRWGRVPKENSDCMLVDEERVYEFIDKMLATSRECFRSNRIHIGMDEAMGIGRGAHLDKHGYEDPNSILKRHLGRVNEMVKAHGYTEPLIWSDMFFRTWNDHKYEDYIGRKEVPSEVKSAVPDDVGLVYWGYSDDNRDTYDSMLYNHRQMSRNVWFAGGLWGWVGITPLNAFSISTMKRALDACVKYKVKDVFMTMWADRGSDGSRFAQLPALYYLAQYAKGVTDEEKIKRGFKRLVGVDYDDFMLLDLPNSPGTLSLSDERTNPSHYMLYCDYFVGYLDCTVERGGGEKYAEYARLLAEAAKKTRKYKHLFKVEALVCEILSHKYELGIKTREAYKRGDMAELERLAREDYSAIERLLPRLISEYRVQWYKDNKPYGFDLHERRIGGLIARTVSCKTRILDYVHGKISAIEELCEDVLPHYEEGRSILMVGERMLTTSLQ